MYLVRCPKCAARMSTPFARVGAVASCTTCHHRFRVEPEMIGRQAPAASGSAQDDPLGASLTETPTTAATTPAQPEASLGAAAAAVAGSVNRPSPLLTARRLRRRRDSQGLRWVFLVVVVVALAMLILAWVGMARGWRFQHRQFIHTTTKVVPVPEESPPPPSEP